MPLTYKETINIISVLQKFQALYPRITCQQVETLLQVSINDGADQSAIAGKANMVASTASKHLRMWSDLNHRKEPGFGFLRLERDPMDLTTNIVRLTEKGREFLNTL